MENHQRFTSDGTETVTGGCGEYGLQTNGGGAKSYKVNLLPQSNINTDSVLDCNDDFMKKGRPTSRPRTVEFVESGEKIDAKTAVLILLSISFGVGYLFLPLSFFVRETIISSTLLIFNFISGFISVYMLMDLRAQVNLGSYQEVAYYMNGNRSTIMAISILFAAFFIINCSVYVQLLGQFTEQFIISVTKKDKLFPYCQQVIIFIEGLILIPMCRVLNFQKFKFLTYPILATVLIIFFCLLFNLGERLYMGYQSDFCQIIERYYIIPSQELGVTYAIVIPSLCYAFGFHIYVLQVNKVMDRPDPNGYRGMKVGLYTLLVTFALYAGILIVTSLYQEPHDKAHVIYVYDIVFDATSISEYLTQVVVIIQLFCHTPFVFYIAQEQVLMLYDEYTRKSMSRMIDEMRRENGNQRMKRFFTQRETVNAVQIDQQEKVDTKTEEQKVYQVTTYRLPYMTLPKKTLNSIFIVVFGIIILMAILQLQWFFNSVSFLGATCVPLSLYVIPGYYYSQYNKGYDDKKYYFGLGFAIFGVIIMICYTALEFYSWAYLLSADPNDL